MKRILLFILTVFAVISCDLEKAQKEYARGEYVKSIETTLKYFDKNENRVKKVNSKVKTEITSKFSNITEYYLKTVSDTGNESEKINAGINLFKIYTMLDSREYTKEFTDFTSRYSAEEFYSETGERIIRRFNEYYNGGLYDKALKELDLLDNYIRITGSSGKNNISKYNRIIENASKVKTDNLIKTAERLEEMKDYRNAEKTFLKAAETYSGYEENYKNSYSRHKENKNKADLNDAEKYYEKGKQTLQESSRKEKYRKAYEYFKKSDYFVKGYKDASKLADMYYREGIFSYKFVGDTRYSDVIEKAFKDIAYRDNINSELIIEYDEKVEYRTNSGNIDKKTEKLTEKIRVGISDKLEPVYEVYNFEKTTVTLKEKIRVNYQIRIDGILYKDRYSNSVEEENIVKKVTYTGKVPPKYRNSIEGKEIGKNEMRKKVEEKIKEDISKRIKIFGERMKRI
ncbi:MAG: hypothetical protein Q4D53_07640 [Leptotrichiaceae bacterium]|nr:hypothetical protein [Leptotrichiaceae bacterium]